MDEIENYRRKLDELDEMIINMLLERFEITKEIGKIKRNHNIEIFQPDREEAIIETIKFICEGHDRVDAVISVYKTIMNESKALQIY